MGTPDITKQQALAWVAAVLAVATVLGSPEVGLGSSPPWVRLVIAAAIVIGVLVAHIVSDAVIRHGRAGALAAQNDRAAAQLNLLAARPEGDDSLVKDPPARSR